MSLSSLNRLHSVNTYHKYWQARTQRQFTHDNNIHLNNTKYTEISLSYTHAHWTHTCKLTQGFQKDRQTGCLFRSPITQKRSGLFDGPVKAEKAYILGYLLYVLAKRGDSHRSLQHLGEESASTTI